VWASADFLLGWIRRQPLPPLAGGGGINGAGVPGGKFAAGAWFDDDHVAGVQAGYFFLGTQESTRVAGSAGSIGACSDGFQGLNVLLRENVLAASVRDQPCWLRVDLALGYSYLTVKEGLVAANDFFGTRNEFHGAQGGFVAELRAAALTAQVEAGLGMGATTQSALVEGPTLGSAGIHHHATFSVVPQFGLRLGWQVLPAVRLSVGYNVLWWTGVVRPGDHPGLATNPLAAAPLAFKDSTVWVQGLVVGVEVCY
jgi:hypothetical protein